MVSPSAARIARNRSLACSTPMMFSGLSRHSGIRVYSVASTSRTSSSGRKIGVEHHHLGAMNHHVGNLQLAKAENVLDVLRLALFHLAMLGRHLHQPPDLDVGQDFLLRALLDAQHPKDRAGRCIEQPVQRVEQQEGDIERIGDPLRDRHRFPNCQGLRHLFADDDVQRGEHQEADHERREMKGRVGHPEPGSEPAPAAPTPSVRPPSRGRARPW